MRLRKPLTGVELGATPPCLLSCACHSLFKVISYDSSRGGVSVITEKGEVTTSYLLIQNAELSDSGKYSCSPSNADVASVRVYVLNGLKNSASLVARNVDTGIFHGLCINPDGISIFLGVLAYNRSACLTKRETDFRKRGACQP
uniref:Ig-like domain-containing protein n=1 Tax=Timema tahoe TaxID=61484 RepID=A0A7R9IKK5_9NEOP|nr:unnamed protein product [Timema tahoe]